MTTNQISLNVTKLDMNFILDNFYKPNLWNKTWTIFAYDKYQIDFQLSSIYPRSSSVYFYINLLEKGIEIESTSVNFNYDKAHRNITAITNSINGNIFRLIEQAETSKIKKMWAFRKAEEASRERIRIYREQAEIKLNELLALDIKIVNEIFEEIKDHYIDSMGGKGYSYSHREAIIKGNRGKVLKSLYLSYMLYAGMDKKREEFIKACNLYAKPTKKLVGEILSDLSNVKKVEFIDTVKADLDDVLEGVGEPDIAQEKREPKANCDGENDGCNHPDGGVGQRLAKERVAQHTLVVGEADQFIEPFELPPVGEA